MGLPVRERALMCVAVATGLVGSFVGNEQERSNLPQKT